MTYKEFVLNLAAAYRVFGSRCTAVAYMCHVLDIDINGLREEAEIRKIFAENAGFQPQENKEFSEKLTEAIHYWIVENQNPNVSALNPWVVRERLQVSEENDNILRATWLENYAESL